MLTWNSFDTRPLGAASVPWNNVDNGYEICYFSDIMYILITLLDVILIRVLSLLSLIFFNAQTYSVLSSTAVMLSSKLTADAKYSVDIGGMRIKYKDKNETFTEEHLVSKEPIGQFKAWFEEASNNPQIFEPNAMFLATATKDGIPSVRPVLLKHYGTDGFKFYTNYESRKGREIAQNSNVAVYFYWEPLRRGVRIEGKAVKTSPEDSDRYFQSRPYSSQIGSMSSKQSSVIASRQTLIVKERELLAQFPEGQVKRPDCWGGYIIIPHSVEFWQGQSDRLHDRIRFRRPKSNEQIDNVLLHQGDNGWVYERLSP